MTPGPNLYDARILESGPVRLRHCVRGRRHHRANLGVEMMHKTLTLLAASAAFFWSSAGGALVPTPGIVYPGFKAPPLSANPWPGKVNNAITTTVQRRATAIGLAANDMARVETVRGIADVATKRAGLLGAVSRAGNILSWASLLMAVPSIVQGVIGLADGTTDPETGLPEPQQQYESLGDAVLVPAGKLIPNYPTLQPSFGTGEGMRRWIVLAINNPNGGADITVNCVGMVAAAAAHCAIHTYEKTIKVDQKEPPWGLTYVKDWGASWSFEFSRPRYISSAGVAKVARTLGVSVGGDYGYQAPSAPQCLTGMASNKTCIVDPIYIAGKVEGTPADAPYYLPGHAKGMPAAPKTLADLIQDMWREAAAQPNYKGIALPLNNPLTEAELEAQRQANSAAWPSLGDLTAPISSAAVAGQTQAAVPLPANGTLQPSNPAYVPDPITGVVTSPTTTTAPALDLGPNPGIGAPADPVAPPMASILDPLFTWFPNTAVTLGPGECPRPTLDVFDEHFVMEAHCTLIEQQRALFSAAFIAIWTMAAAFIILRA